MLICWLSIDRHQTFLAFSILKWHNLPNQNLWKTWIQRSSKNHLALDINHRTRAVSWLKLLRSTSLNKQNIKINSEKFSPTSWKDRPCCQWHHPGCHVSWDPEMSYRDSGKAVKFTRCEGCDDLTPKHKNGSSVYDCTIDWKQTLMHALTNAAKPHDMYLKGSSIRVLKLYKFASGCQKPQRVCGAVRVIAPLTVTVVSFPCFLVGDVDPWLWREKKDAPSKPAPSMADTTAPHACTAKHSCISWPAQLVVLSLQLLLLLWMTACVCVCVFQRLSLE